MRYFDTSFLVPLVLPEAASEPIAGFFETLPAAELDAAAARAAGSRLETMVGESFVVLLPNRDDFGQAKDWLAHFETGLRAADSLHLAIAGNRGAEAIYSLDKLMITAGKTLGLPASAGSLPGYGD